MVSRPSCVAPGMEKLSPGVPRAIKNKECAFELVCVCVLLLLCVCVCVCVWGGGGGWVEGWGGVQNL